MTATKTTTMVALLALFLVGWRYATPTLPAAASGIEYRSANWLQRDCGLTLARQGATVSISYGSRAHFLGPWPSAEGDVYFSVTEGETDESLLVTFANRDGRLEPIKFMHQDVRRLQNHPEAAPEICTALQKHG